MPFLEGFVIIVLGIFLFMTNFGFMDAEIWKWLFPVAIMLFGFRWITGNASSNSDCEAMDDCYEVDMMCCEDDECSCGGKEEECSCEEGACTCSVASAEGKEEEGGCCGGGCACGDKEDKK